MQDTETPCDYCGIPEEELIETDHYGKVCTVCYEVIREEDPTVRLAELGF